MHDGGSERRVGYAAGVNLSFMHCQLQSAFEEKRAFVLRLEIMRRVIRQFKSMNETSPEGLQLSYY